MARVVESQNVGRTYVAFKCPGCKHSHYLPVSGDGRPAWDWNGSQDLPTLRPSILHRSGHYVGDKAPGDCWCDMEERLGFAPSFKCGVCHSFVTDGNIQFLGDCTHELAGQTVPLPEVVATP